VRIKKNFLPWLGSHFLEFWYYYIFAVFSLYILHTSQVEIPELAKKTGDLLIEGRFDNALIFKFFKYALLIVIFRTLSRWLFFYPARVQQKNLRLEILEIIKESHPNLYNSYSNGQIYQIILGDFDRLRGFIGFALLQIGNLVIAVYVLYPKISAINSVLFIAFIPMSISVVIFSIVMLIFQPYMKKGVEIQGDVQNNIIESFDAKQSVANFQQEESFVRKFKKISHKEIDYFFKASLGPAIARPLVPLGVSFSLLWGAKLISELGLGVTHIILFSGFLFLALEPLMFLSWIGVVITSFIPSWKRIKKFIATLTGELDYPGTLKLSETQGSFELPMWDGKLSVSLDFNKNEIIGLCGPTGIGKTFFLEELAKSMHKENLNFNYVLQEPHLFDGNVLDNILLSPNCTKEAKAQVKELIKIFSLDDLGHNLDSVLKIEVGENGKKLSGGQIKRVALIQSLISQSHYLIWDDPFSSVDNILEQEIMRALIENGYLKDKFLIMSSHRITTLQFCENILLLENKSSMHLGELGDERINEFFKFQMDSVL